MTKNTLIIIIVALIIGGAIGYAGAGYQYSAQLNKVRAMFPTQTSMTFVSGTIQSISGNTITLQTPQSGNPFEDLPTVRTVTVTSATKIVKSTPKDPAVFQQEMAAYQKAVQKAVSSTTTPPTMPTPINQTPLDLSKLKAGDMILVDAGKNVATLTNFDAVLITLTAQTIPPPGAAGTAGAVTPPPPGTGTAPIVNTPPPVKK